ncbi:hypothetical protein IWX49DRAFT_244714 [Phyllosticta citricarpa]|uniref:Uncharacterized protein n=2 Tax=Phyllosticta TaxID=121621 RepID=A0ABR1L5V3_9PEZI
MNNRNTNNNNNGNLPPKPPHPTGQRRDSTGYGGQNPWTVQLPHYYTNQYRQGYSHAVPITGSVGPPMPMDNPQAFPYGLHIGQPELRQENPPTPSNAVPLAQPQTPKLSADQLKKSKPSSLDVEILIQEESAKAKAKASIVARNVSSSLSLTDKEGSLGGETTCSKVQEDTATETMRLPARIDSPMGLPHNMIPSIPFNPISDNDVKDWLTLTGFHDMEFRKKMLGSFRQQALEKNSVVPDIEQNPRAVSRPLREMEEQGDAEYIGRVRDPAKRFRGEFLPELLREPAALEEFHGRVGPREDLRERAMETARSLDAKTLPNLRRSPSPYLNRYSNQRQEPLRDHGSYRDRHDFQPRDPHPYDRRESLERASDRNDFRDHGLYRDRRDFQPRGSYPSARRESLERDSDRNESERHSRGQYYGYEMRDRSRSPIQDYRDRQTIGRSPWLSPSGQRLRSGRKSRAENAARRVGSWQERKPRHG